MFERIKTFALNGRIRYNEAKLLNDQMLNLSNYILPETDADDWKLLNSNTEKGLDDSEQEDLRSQSIKTYYKSGHGRNIIRLFEKYTVGRGFKIEPISTLPQVKDAWKDFCKVNKMHVRIKEIVRRTMRDGECFNRFFEDDVEVMKIRFMNPSMVQNPDDQKNNDNISSGIETDPDDVETVLNYYYKGKPIPADQVQHLKIMVDSDVLRGRSYLEPVLQLLTMYKKWLMDRMKLNEIRNTVALIKKVKGTPTQTQNVADKYKTSRKLNNDSTAMARSHKSINVITTNQNVEYDLKSPNLQAADVQHDGRALLLAVAAGSGLPEFMVSSDASNSSYASTMVAEGPAVMEFEDWQDYFAEACFKEIFTRVIEHGIKNGKIPTKEVITERILNPKTGVLEEKKETIDTSTECSITFPDIVSRDIERETKAYIMQSQAGWLSDVTAQGKLDLDHEEEKRLIDQQIKDDGGPGVEKDEEDLEIEKARKAMEDEE